MDILFKELNNKSRKGVYLYIKDKTKSRYYKFDEAKGLDFYVNYFNTTKKNRIHYKKYETKYYESQKIPTKTKSKYSLNDIEKGISNITIKDVHNLSQSDLNKQIKKLFSKVVKDKQILNLITQEANLDKLKKRLSYRLNLYDENGKLMGDYVVTDFKTPTKVIEAIKGKVTKGSKFSDGYHTGLDSIGGLKSNNSLKSGYVSRFELQVTFIKRR